MLATSTSRAMSGVCGAPVSFSAASRTKTLRAAVGLGSRAALTPGVSTLQRSAPLYTAPPAARLSHTCYATADAGVLQQDDGADNRGPNKLLIGLAAVAVAGTTAAVVGGHFAHLATYLNGTALVKSGLLPAFSLLVASEIGDKTFFMAALLAMRLGRVLTFFGASSSLALMTVISVSMGRVANMVPAIVESSFPIGEYIGAALMLYFGTRSLIEYFTSSDDDTDEFDDAEEAIAAADEKGLASKNTGIWQSFVEIFTLVFMAEWGDRSMLACVALGAAKNPYAVSTGALMGHMLATLIAVLGGSMISKHINERQVSLIGGVLFLLFAVGTVMGVC